MLTAENRLTAMVPGLSSTGRDAEWEYLRRARSFDPYSAMRTASQGAYNSLMPQLSKAFKDLRGSEVGSGRLNSGFGKGDEDYLLGQGLDRLNSLIAQNALQASSLQFQNNQSLGEFGNAKTGQAIDILAGNRDAAVARENAKRQERASMFGSLANFGGGLAALAFL